MSPIALNATLPATDPAVYDVQHKAFADSPLPQNEREWIARASQVAHVLSEDVTIRDREQKIPEAEVSLLKSSGLTKVMGPTKYGGGGQSWDVAYKVIREVAKGDGSLGMLLGYHLLWSWTAHIVGTDEQRDRLQEQIVKNNYFIGGAVNPRDSDVKITSEDGYIVFDGFKNFNTGGVISDLTVLEGVLEGSDGAHIFAFAPTRQAGIQFAHNWNNMGLRLTESGSVKIDHVAVPWEDALGWDAKVKKPLAEVLDIPWASLLLPTIQLVFSNFYIGIAVGALNFSVKYTAQNTRPWPYGGDNKDSASDEFYILERYGNFFAHLRAAEALADKAGSVIADIYNTKSEKRDLTPRERGEAAEWVASVKVVATDTALRVTAGVFEVTGARATSTKVGLDRFWRDVRTHTLHDPVSYKNRELGRFALLDEVPEPSWYT
ncbi:MAG: hypothetical protein M1821_001804 [Bathelium mastoideum]|nr:MAG: hypothetical protein M1821_001804 [Bathelium mastoideum]